MTVKLAEAELPWASDTESGYWLGVKDAGTLKFAENEPVESVVALLKVSGDLLKVAVNGEPAAKPEPETVTDEPTFPLVGLKLIEDVTLKAVEAVFALASVAVRM
jgi:hypothetical protein